MAKSNSISKKRLHRKPDETYEPGSMFMSMFHGTEIEGIAAAWAGAACAQLRRHPEWTPDNVVDFLAASACGLLYEVLAEKDPSLAEEDRFWNEISRLA